MAELLLNNQTITSEQSVGKDAATELSLRSVWLLFMLRYSETHKTVEKSTEINVANSLEC